VCVKQRKLDYCYDIVLCVVIYLERMGFPGLGIKIHIFSERVSGLSLSFSKVSTVFLLYYSVVLKFDGNCIRSSSVIRLFTSSGPFTIL